MPRGAPGGRILRGVWPGTQSLTRPIAVLLTAVTLVVGVVVGVTAGGLVVDPEAASPSAIAVVSPSPSASPDPRPSSTPRPAPEPTATPEPTPTPAPTPRMVAAPLTGMPVTEAVARRPVIAVMIDDQSAARPQSGLGSASVVWQAPAEGGIPRYLALFQDTDPPSVGPVRSARHYFIAWAAEWRSVFVHVGGSPQAVALLRSADGRGRVVYDADEYRWGGRYLYRIAERLAPHNVYSDAKQIRALAKAVGAKPMDYEAAWQFAPDATLEKRPEGSRILVPYLANRISYAYDRRSNRWLRAVTGESRQTDAGTGDRIAPKNVVIMLMSFAPLNDGSSKRRLEARYTGTGTAWIATNGQAFKGTWKKNSMTGATRFYTKDGKPVTLTMGQTFVQVVPIGTRLTIRNGKVPPLRSRPAVAGHADPRWPLPR